MINLNNLVVNEVLPEREFPINRRTLVAYANASGDQNPIHQDEAFAKSVGLPDVIAHGMLTMGLVGTYLAESFGSENIASFSVRFVKPVVVPAATEVILNISAIVQEITETQIKVEISAKVSDQKVLGKAIAILNR
jgi:acyl dehydratase